MTWNVKNLFPSVDPAGEDAYRRKIDGLRQVITTAGPDLLSVQEVGDPTAFTDLLTALGDGWAGVLSPRPDGRGTRVGWATPHGQDSFTEVADVVDFPPLLGPVRTDDHGTTITGMKRGGLAVTWTSSDGVSLRACTAHLKSKLLTFPRGRFSTTDKGLRARYGVYALDERAAEAATLRGWSTDALAGQGQTRPVLVCGDLNDTPTLPPPNCSSAHPAPNSAPAGTTNPTPPTGTSCGMWRRRCHPDRTKAGSPTAATNSSTTFSSPTNSCTTSTTPAPSPSTGYPTPPPTPDRSPEPQPRRTTVPSSPRSPCRSQPGRLA